MRQFFTENNDRLSMKRLCGFICTVSLCIATAINPTDAMVYSITMLSASTLGLTTVEKIFKNERLGNTRKNKAAASETEG